MEKILNQPLSKFKQYSTYNEKFFYWIAEEILKDKTIFSPFKSDKEPWKDFDLILKETVSSDEYWYIFKVISSDITSLELKSIIEKRSQVIASNSSFFQNCKSFIFIFVSDIEDYPIDLNIEEFKHSYWSQIFSVNLFVNTRNGEYTSIRLPIRFIAGIEYLESKILQKFRDENEYGLNLDYKSTMKDINSSIKYKKMRTKRKQNYKYGTYLPLKLKKEQQLVKLKGILKIHSKMNLDFVARKLNTNRNEIESLIYEATGNDQLDLIMIDKDTIASRKLKTKDFKPNLPEKTINENIDKLYNIEKCMICNKEVESLDEMAVCPHCANIAHKTEFLEWIKIKQKCPVCKKKLQAKELMIKAKK